MARTAWAAMVVLLPACQHDVSPTSDLTNEPVRFGLPLQPSSALALIAAEKGYFDAEGLEPTFDEHVSGKRALDTLLAGAIDVATMAQVPFVLAAFDRTDFSTVATIASLKNVERIVARKDRGIVQPADLRGKRVGTQKGSAVHFFLYIFLIKNKLSDKDIQTVFMESEELVPALAEGRIDAFSMREPFVSQALELLGDRAVEFSEPDIYFRTEHLVVSNALIRDKPQVVRKLLRALVRAQQFTRTHQESAVQIVAAKLGIEPSRQAMTWPDLDLQVALGQSILTSMEDQAEWAIESGLTEKREIPNYLPFVYLDALEVVKPDAVSIIR